MIYSRSCVIALLVCAVSIGIIEIDTAYAHKAQVVGDYKVDVGWKTEPPIANEPNAIEVVITIASDFDKQRSDAIYFKSSSPASEKDITGLADDLEVYVKVGDEEKTLLTLFEDPKIPGIYYGEFTPQETGRTKIDVYGTINGGEFGATFHPEKVEENLKEINVVLIPEWIRNNAKWWSEGTISDSDFVSGIQYLIKHNILNVPATEEHADENNNQDIPSWIKNNAGWWANGVITDDDFVNGIQYMITNGMISV
ncbi:hypothetical protein YTPLAS73_13140 [Nitrosarchaeum sp.]|nr:hypothetical protein YTPLAS73_13140 [Nitrosarchaeum sp.]